MDIGHKVCRMSEDRYYIRYPYLSIKSFKLIFFCDYLITVIAYIGIKIIMYLCRPPPMSVPNALNLDI